MCIRDRNNPRKKEDYYNTISYFCRNKQGNKNIMAQGSRQVQTQAQQQIQTLSPQQILLSLIHIYRTG